MDVLRGLGGDDTLGGGDGLDTLEGGNGNDTITGGNGNDTLTGGNGNDSIDGGDGDDTAVFSGNSSDYSIVFGAGQVVVTDNVPGDGDDGSDTLTGVEFLEFADQTVSGTNQPPTAEPDTWIVSVATTASWPEAVLLNNDSDPEDNPLVLVQQ